MTASSRLYRRRSRLAVSVPPVPPPRITIRRGIRPTCPDAPRCDRSERPVEAWALWPYPLAPRILRFEREPKAEELAIRAVVYQGPGGKSWEEVPKPVVIGDPDPDARRHPPDRIRSWRPQRQGPSGRCRRHRRRRPDRS